jgi:hypothetical protein
VRTTHLARAAEGQNPEWKVMPLAKARGPGKANGGALWHPLFMFWDVGARVISSALSLSPRDADARPFPRACCAR